jgi:hypothetical protein
MTGRAFRLGKLEAAVRDIGQSAKASAALARWLAGNAIDADYRVLLSSAHLAHLSDDEIFTAIETMKARLQ